MEPCIPYQNHHHHSMVVTGSWRVRTCWPYRVKLMSNINNTHGCESPYMEKSWTPIQSGHVSVHTCTCAYTRALKVHTHETCVVMKLWMTCTVLQIIKTTISKHLWLCTDKLVFSNQTTFTKLKQLWQNLLWHSYHYCHHIFTHGKQLTLRTYVHTCNKTTIFIHDL